MHLKKKPSRQIPGIFSYMELFQSKKLSYSIFFGTPIVFGVFSLLLHYYIVNELEFFHFFRFVVFFLLVSSLGTLFSISLYSKKAPILRAPPNGWVVQMNTYFTATIEVTFLFGQIIAILLQNVWYHKVFLILGTILSYILAFVIYFSFTTVDFPGYLILSLIQPISAIILYSLYIGQFDIDFFTRAMIFFVVCALIFAIPYRRGLFHVSNVYREATGMKGYPFIRAFVLSMMTDGNDELIESFFERVGIKSPVKIQYLFIRRITNRVIKGLFIIPNVHFGPFKTCGSSDLPEHIYKAFEEIPGTTVYHTTNDHTQNLTTQRFVDVILDRIKRDINLVKNGDEIIWENQIKGFSRKISNTAKLLGTEISNVPIVFITRHPLPSDDIEAEIGDQIRDQAISNGYKDIIIIDSHNAILGDEILIKKDSIESQDLINVSNKFTKSNKVRNSPKVQMLYGVAKGTFQNYTEKDGIGYGGIVLHLFKNLSNGQKTALIHFDGNNAYADIRSYILNMLQNKGIVRGEVTTSDSHTVARQFSGRGYSPIGDKIKIDEILRKLDNMIEIAESNLEPVEFYYKSSTEDNVKIWGNPRYFYTILDTLKECIKVSQRLLTLSLIIPTFFSLILLLFLYNV
ncbi:hypothetical protein LCGC14_0679370 [marine sediment metagenome]|uniref:DUF2070 domain-containing protein n=1 Tax=marine sediment metagenome TaxID=412755 RepID=A0A0F9QTS9_9ZZZZ